MKIIDDLNLALIKDITLIVGSLTATVFTFRSFSKWKKEHKGKIKYELSRNVLKSIYDLRDDFKSVRSPMILVSEFPPDFSLKQDKGSEKYKYIFENRLKYLQKSYNVFLSLQPEIEFEYDLEINNSCDELIRHIQNYHFKISEYIQLVDNWNPITNPYHKDLHSIIFNNNENNETTVSFNETIEKLKKLLLKEIKKY